MFRNLFRSKYQALFEQSQSNYAALEGHHTVEIAKRIAAETLATERGKESERIYKLLEEANTARDAAVSERLKSLDLVNLSLLRPTDPEKKPDMKQYSVARRPIGMIGSQRRTGDAAFIQNQLRAQGIIKPRVIQESVEEAS